MHARCTSPTEGQSVAPVRDMTVLCLCSLLVLDVGGQALVMASMAATTPSSSERARLSALHSSLLESNTIEWPARRSKPFLMRELMSMLMFRLSLSL